jgi:small subunit ribosomal protein S6
VGLREYEVMLILAAEADESVVSTAVDRITKTVAGSGGEVGNIDRWGRRRFAYEINDQNEGYYVVVRFTAEPTTQVDLDRVLTLADEVIRFKVMVRPEPKASSRDKGGKVGKVRMSDSPEARAAEAAAAPPAVAAPEVSAAEEAPAAEEPAAADQHDEDDKEASPAPA